MTGKRISDDVKQIIVRMSVVLPTADIVVYTGVTKRTVQRIIEYHRKYGTVSTVHSGQVGRPALLDESDKMYLRGALQHAPDRYLDELKEEMERTQGVCATIATLSRYLKSMGYTMKQIHKAAIEQSESLRAAYKYKMGLWYTPNQLVFVDESSCDRRSTFRNRAWAIRGERVRKSVFFVRGKRYSVLPALSIEGVISLKIVEGSFDTISFMEFIDCLLENMNPFPGDNSVVVMDNCRIHKSELIREMVEARGMRVEYLPPYSPDYNPIELLFSSMKGTIKRNDLLIRSAMQARNDFEVYATLHDIVWSVPAEDAEGWYKKCGYF